MPQKISRSVFIERAKNIHPEYNYDKVEYVNAHTKVIVGCPIHGDFLIAPEKHTYNLKKGCPKCAYIKGGLKNRLTTQEFIERAKKVHGDAYNYSETKLDGSHNYIDVICSKHGKFRCKPFNHLNGNRCRACATESFFDTQEDFLNKARKKHWGLYDYSKTVYKNSHTPVEIICKKHGSFFMKPERHISKSGCPKCRKSKGEIEIQRFLDEHGIKYIEQKTFTDCRNPETGGTPRFDFYLPDYNLIIEYDGQQHTKAISFWNEKFGDGEKRLTERLKRDKFKNEYCSKNQINLFRISYRYRRTIYKRLQNYFNEQKPHPSN